MSAGLQGFPGAPGRAHAPARAHLDHAAGSPLRPEARAAVIEALDRGGNPSSIHGEGRAARRAVERAREQVAALVGAEAQDVVFTSGGTEANATALRPGALLAADGRPVARLITAATEHPSVLRGHGFAAEDAILLPVGRDGLVAEADLAAALAALDAPCLVSLQVANSETGIVQPLARLAALARAQGAAIHADAVQAAGKMPLAMAALGLDALSLSGHKLGAPSGIGALVLAPGRAGPGLRLLGGGDQETRRRAGTENVGGIAGFGAAAAAAHRDLGTEPARLAALRDAAERALAARAPDIVIVGAGVPRLPGTLAFAVPGVAAETALVALDLAGIAVSSGSACSSGKVGRSHVLAAMGMPADLARCALRVSFGWSSEAADVDRLLAGFDSRLARLYGRERAHAA